jgi:hypothetical protein
LIKESYKALNIFKDEFLKKETKKKKEKDVTKDQFDNFKFCFLNNYESMVDLLKEFEKNNENEDFDEQFNNFLLQGSCTPFFEAKLKNRFFGAMTNKLEDGSEPVNHQNANYMMGQYNAFKG